MSIPKNSRIVLIRLVSLVLMTVAACSPNLDDDPIPMTAFPTITINLNLPEYVGLKSKGGHKEISGGVRGIILYCQDIGVYYAYERNCSYHPNDACATVNVDVSQLFMIDPCCGSSFDFATGMPTGGAAWRTLRKYETRFNGVDLTITDEVIEE